MVYDSSDLFVKIENWAEQSVTDGWIDQHQALSLTVAPDNSASELFVSHNDRPLVVAFMGGTGVGKSSLLNALSGQSIARTGVERPTSREVTLYHHQKTSLHQLEQVFPLQNIQVSQHNDESNERVVWIDMPDFDSTEEKNKDIVMQWLPYVDVLIYVVSPERYRDKKAWQLLLAEGASHAWVFVMNQWDRGEISQFDDFKKQLALAGFTDPIIYKTVCHSGPVLEANEVEALQQSITSLASKNTIEQLEHRGIQQRNYAIKQNLQSCFQLLGEQKTFLILLEKQQSQWNNIKAMLTEGFEWPIKQLSIVYAKQGSVKLQDAISIWDEWAQSRFNDYLDQLILYADQCSLPSSPLRKMLSAYRQKAEAHIQTQTELSCRKAMINPGNFIQRSFLKIVKVAEIVLPIAAMGLVGFQVFQGYYDSAVSEQAFLGVNFAVHSTLLVVISWLLPFFIRKKMQPSLEKAALKGLNRGVELAMSLIDSDVKKIINELKQRHQTVTAELSELMESCDQRGQLKTTAFKNEQLQRMLINE